MQDIQKILQLGYNQVVPKSGRVLLSEPFLNDNVFERSVVLIVEHNKSGSVGFMLNKPLQLSLSKFVNDIDHFKDPVYLGGPVECDCLFGIFRGNYHSDSAIEFMECVFLETKFEKLIQLIKEKKLQQNEFRLFFGYSGWDAGQLDRELKENTWVISKLTQDEIFTAPTNKLWQIGLEKIGGDYSKWKYLPKSPDLN